MEKEKKRKKITFSGSFQPTSFHLLVKRILLQMQMDACQLFSFSSVQKPFLGCVNGDGELSLGSVNRAFLRAAEFGAVKREKG